MPARITTPWSAARIRRAADAALVALLASLPLLWRTTRPLAAYAAVLAGAAGLVALSTPHQGPFEPFAALVLGGYSVGAHTHGRRVRAGVAVTLGSLVAIEILNLLFWHQHQTDVLPAIGWIGAAWLIGRIVHGRSHRAVELEALAHELDEQRELQARVAVVDERARIARELHDVVAHNVSMIVVQAGAAAGVLEGEQPHVREALAAIEVTGRETVDEMRRLLGVLRRADDGPALAPQPTLRELDALAAHVREAGLPVELRVEGAPRPLPPGVDVSAFRIVQEALTNALKHAGRPARARVTVRYQPGVIEVEIEDNGTGGGNGGGTGHGLIGMRERVALYGGRLDAGRSDSGGYTVKARLPLGGAAA
jgi:signal transduction histidine kinase